MHAIFFGLKRAWHGSLRATRRGFAAFGLTAARFDLLYALPRGRYRHGVAQKDLRRKLGVNRTTISRMLGSLLALGLVTRERATHGYGDGRTWYIRLTDEGCSRVLKAIARLIDSGTAQLMVDTAVVGARCEEWFHCLYQEEVLECFLKGIRMTFCDVATLYYPWQPDD